MKMVFLIANCSSKINIYISPSTCLYKTMGLYTRGLIHGAGGVRFLLGLQAGSEGVSIHRMAYTWGSTYGMFSDQEDRHIKLVLLDLFNKF